MILTDDNVPLLIAAMAFVVICLITIGVMIHVRGLRYRRGMLDKLRSSGADWAADDAEPMDLTLAGEAAGSLVRFLGALGARLKSDKARDDVQTKLKFLRAGLRGPGVATVFWGTKFMMAVLLPMAFLVVAMVVIKTMQTNHIMLGVAFCALLGLVLPDMWLRSRTRRRKERLIRAFPDMLDLLVVCVEAGMGLDAAISRVGEELDLSHAELSQELKLLNLELRAGKSRTNALRNLAQRTDIEDVNSLVTLLIQTDRFGTSIAQALKVFADSFRTARFQRAEEFAAKIGTKLIFPLALFIFPSFFVVVIGPAALQVYRVLLKG